MDMPSIINSKMYSNVPAVDKAKYDFDEQTAKKFKKMKEHIFKHLDDCQKKAEVQVIDKK